LGDRLKFVDDGGGERQTGAALDPRPLAIWVDLEEPVPPVLVGDQVYRAVTQVELLGEC
jgi:hypothetical protein